MREETKRLTARIVFGSLAILIIVTLVFSNIVPFGSKIFFSITSHKNNLMLFPKERIKEIVFESGVQFHQINDLIYFLTDIQHQYDIAKVKIYYKNSSLQSLELGFQDQEIWHYFTEYIDSPILNDYQNAFSIGIKPRIYQKDINYKTVDDFFRNPPRDKVIGHYAFDENLLKQVSVLNYSPSKDETVIEPFTRGKIVLYTYLENEPFIINFQKKDLNWYEDPDVVTVNIYKEKDIVYSTIIEDDGITDSSKSKGQVNIAQIKNPGPGLPEKGLYKIVIDSGIDSVLTSITTNLHLIVFDSPIFIASDPKIYPNIRETSTNINIFTDAFGVSGYTYHEAAFQDIQVGNQILKLEQVNTEASVSGLLSEATTSAGLEQWILNQVQDDSGGVQGDGNEIPEGADSGQARMTDASGSSQLDQSANLIPITIPKSDVVLKAELGYFAFSPEQYFKPSDFRLYPVTKKEDLDKIDYLITNYKPSERECVYNEKQELALSGKKDASPSGRLCDDTPDDDFRIAEAEFDLRDAYVKNGKLSWIIKAPGLKERGGEVIIKDIEVELIKRPLIDPKILPEWLRKLLGVKIQE